MICIMLIGAAFVDIIRVCFKFYLARHRTKCIYYISLFLTLNILFNITNIIVLNIFRLSHNGRVCSGDFLTSKDKEYYSQFLIIRGTFFIILIIVHWSLILIFLLYLFIIPVCMGCCKKKKKLH